MSRDPAAQPEIDPNYFDHEVDLDVLVETAKFCRKLGSVAPLRDMIGEPVAYPSCFVIASSGVDSGLAEKEVKPGAAVETEQQFRGTLR